VESRARHEDTQPISEDRRAQYEEWSRKAVAGIQASSSDTDAYAAAVRAQDAAAIRKIYRKYGMPAGLKGAKIIFDDHTGTAADAPKATKPKVSISITITFKPLKITADIGPAKAS
jgi:hypothetical protein